MIKTPVSALQALSHAPRITVSPQGVAIPITCHCVLGFCLNYGVSDPLISFKLLLTGRILQITAYSSLIDKSMTAMGTRRSFLESVPMSITSSTTVASLSVQESRSHGILKSSAKIADAMLHVPNCQSQVDKGGIVATAVLRIKSSPMLSIFHLPPRS